jgi:hypothetical protein
MAASMPAGQLRQNLVQSLILERHSVDSTKKDIVTVEGIATLCTQNMSHVKLRKNFSNGCMKSSQILRRQNVSEKKTPSLSSDPSLALVRNNPKESKRPLLVTTITEILAGKTTDVTKEMKVTILEGEDMRPNVTTEATESPKEATVSIDAKKGAKIKTIVGEIDVETTTVGRETTGTVGKLPVTETRAAGEITRIIDGIIDSKKGLLLPETTTRKKVEPKIRTLAE